MLTRVHIAVLVMASLGGCCCGPGPTQEPATIGGRPAVAMVMKSWLILDDEVESLLGSSRPPEASGYQALGSDAAQSLTKRLDGDERAIPLGLYFIAATPGEEFSTRLTAGPPSIDVLLRLSLGGQHLDSGVRVSSGHRIAYAARMGHPPDAPSGDGEVVWSVAPAAEGDTLFAGREPVMREGKAYLLVSVIGTDWGKSAR